MAANPHRGEVTARLRTQRYPDGKDFVLRPTFEALSQIETLHGGKPLLDVIKALSRHSVVSVGICLTALLRAGGTEIDRDDLATILEKTGISDAVGPIVMALNGFIDGEGRRAEGNAGAAEPGAS